MMPEQEPPPPAIDQIKRALGLAQVAAIGCLLLVILLILLHNILTPAEKDIPTETIVNLVRYVPTLGAWGLRLNETLG